MSKHMIWLPPKIYEQFLKEVTGETLDKSVFDVNSSDILSGKMIAEFIKPNPEFVKLLSPIEIEKKLPNEFDDYSDVVLIEKIREV